MACDPARPGRFMIGAMLELFNLSTFYTQLALLVVHVTGARSMISTGRVIRGMA